MRLAREAATKDSGTTRWSASFIKSATASVVALDAEYHRDLPVASCRTTSIDPSGEGGIDKKVEASARARRWSRDQQWGTREQELSKAM